MSGVNAFRLCVYICIPPPFFSKNLMSYNCTCHYDSYHSSEWPYIIQEDGVCTVEYWWREMPSSLMFCKVGLFISLPPLPPPPPPPPPGHLMFVLKGNILFLFLSIRHYCHTFYGSIWLHIWSCDVISCTERKDSNQRSAKCRFTFRSKSCSKLSKLFTVP